MWLSVYDGRTLFLSKRGEKENLTVWGDMTIKLQRLRFGETYRFGGSLSRDSLVSATVVPNTEEEKHKASLVVVTKLPKNEAREVLDILGLIDGLG